MPLIDTAIVIAIIFIFGAIFYGKLKEPINSAIRGIAGLFSKGKEKIDDSEYITTTQINYQ